MCAAARTGWRIPDNAVQLAFGHAITAGLQKALIKATLHRILDADANAILETERAKVALHAIPLGVAGGVGRAVVEPVVVHG